MRILVLGGSGMVGRLLTRRLEKEYPEDNVIALNSKHDLRDPSVAKTAISGSMPRQIWMVAGKVGGIGDNMNSNIEMLTDNTLMIMNAINAALEADVPEFNFIGSSCMYPYNSPQPMFETDLWNGRVEPTNAGYATAKLLGAEMIQQARHMGYKGYRTFIPCNLYHEHDKYGENGHVMASLVRKIVIARENNAPVEIWGTGVAHREFLYAEDAVDAMVQASIKTDYSIMNIGSGKEISILNLAKLIGELAGYEGEFKLNPSMPDGMMQKLMDVSLLRSHPLNWEPKYGFKETIQRMIDFYASI